MMIESEDLNNPPRLWVKIRLIYLKLDKFDDKEKQKLKEILREVKRGCKSSRGWYDPIIEEIHAIMLRLEGN